LDGQRIETGRRDARKIREMLRRGELDDVLRPAEGDRAGQRTESYGRACGRTAGV